MKTTLLILTLATLAGTSSLRAEEITHPPINPALLYWQAAALLPKLTDDQSKNLREIVSGHLPFDATKAQGLAADEYSLRLMQKATASTASCDWGLPMEDGPEMAVPHISKMQEMAALAIVHAESLFAAGKTKEALDWLLIVHRMARHVGANDFLISNLVQFVIEMNALRAAARHCLSWDQDTRHAYASVLQTLPPLHSTQAAFRNEHVFVDWIENKLSATRSKDEAEKLLKSLLGEFKPEDQEALAAELAPGALHEALTDLRAFHGRTETALGKPWSEAQPDLKAITEEATHSPHYLVRVSYPMMANVGDKQYAVATLHTMLDAALEHGPQLDAATASTYHDAFQGEPLILKKAADDTLTLQTSHQHPAGKDLSLPLGK